MTGLSKTTTRSIWFLSCVLFGLLLAWLDGIDLFAVAKTALLATVIFVAYLIGEAAWHRYKKKA